MALPRRRKARRQSAPPRDELVVSTPLGQTLAEISGDAATRRYELTRSEGRRETADDWTALMLERRA